MRQSRRERAQLERGLMGSGPLGPVVRAAQRAYAQPVDEATTQRHIAAIVAATADVDPAAAAAFAPAKPRPRALRLAPRIAAAGVAGAVAMSGLAYAGVPVPNPVQSVVQAVNPEDDQPEETTTPAAPEATHQEDTEGSDVADGTSAREPTITVTTTCSVDDKPGTCTSGSGSTATKGSATATKGKATTTRSTTQFSNPSPAPAPEPEPTPTTATPPATGSDSSAQSVEPADGAGAQ